MKIYEDREARGAECQVRNADYVQRAMFLCVLLCLVTTVLSGEIAVQRDANSGDVVLEGARWKAEFRKSEGVVFSSAEQALRVVPFTTDGTEADRLVSCELKEATSPDGKAVHARFSAGGKPIEAVFSFSDYGTLRLTPGKGMAGLYVRCPVAVGVLPGQRLEDVLYLPEQHTGPGQVHVPAENWFAGLLQGGNGILACAWPQGAQVLSLIAEADAPEARFGGLRISLDGKDLFVDILAAPGIWHREPLELSYLEKDIEIGWQRPFPATYRTQLLMKGETTTPRSFAFADRRREEWRPETGAFVWPLWFDGPHAWIHLSKRIPPKGAAVIYPAEGGDDTLMGFLRRTPVASLIRERNEGTGLPKRPRDAPNVGYNACWGTYLLRRTLYTLGVQEREKVFLREHTDYLADRVARIQMRNTAYAQFIEAMRATLHKHLATEKTGDVRSYLEQMVLHLDRVEEGHARKMELYGDHTPQAHIEHVNRNAQRLKELLETPSPEVYAECEKLIDEFNRLSWGHDESTGMRFSMLTREWAQAAALACADTPAAVVYAQEIRAAICDALTGAPSW